MFLPYWNVDSGFRVLFKGAERLRPDYADNLSADADVIDKCGAQRSSAEIQIGGFLIDYTEMAALASDSVLRKPLAIDQRKS